MVGLMRCTRCGAKLHYDEEKMDWRNDTNWPVCPRGGPHKVFVPKPNWDDLDKLLTDGG